MLRWYICHFKYVKVCLTFICVRNASNFMWKVEWLRGWQVALHFFLWWELAVKKFKKIKLLDNINLGLVKCCDKESIWILSIYVIIFYFINPKIIG